MFATVRSKIVILSAHSKKLSNLLFLSSANNFHQVLKSSIFFKTVRFKHSTVPGIQYTPPGSRYVPPDPVESAEMSILSALKNKTFMTDEDWEDFKSKLFEQENFISEENFSSIVMNTLLSSNQLNFSHTFLKYAEKCEVKPNFLTYLKYISLCSKNRKAVNQEHILKIIDKVKKEIDASPVLDNKRAEYIVQGLCATDRWRESFQYFDKLLSGKPTRVMCASVACAALRNNDEALAWEILTKWINKYDIVDDAVIQEFVEFALEIQAKSCYESDKFLEKLFHYMQERDVIVNMDVAKLIEVYFKSHHLKWSVTHTKVRRHGYCEKCNFRLKLLNLRDQDFNDLREAFLQRAVMKSDIYINTTAREFKNYMELIDTFKPFHVVLDGLNAAYSYQGFISKKNLSMHTQEYYSQKVFQIQLLRVVNKLAGKRRKLLVLGRKHMKGWPNIQKICDRAQLFFTDNISQDDPFTVYAALASGPHTLFLSGDLMRDHYSRLDDPRLIHLFKRWQLSHQMFLKISDYNEIEFVEPVRHSITVQGSMEHGWHIPFDDKIILDPYEELNNWLCIKKCI